MRSLAREHGATSHRRRRHGAEATVTCLFMELPTEVQLLIADWVDELAGRAALCLALPPLGLAAVQTLERYQDILMSVALRLPRLRGAVPADVPATALLDEQLMRSYAADRRATEAGRLWLNAGFAEAGSELQVQQEMTKVRGGDATMWLLADGGRRALLRKTFQQTVGHFEGEGGAERRVRVDRPDGSVDHYEGERRAERVVRTVCSDGIVGHCEGEKGAERIVRMVRSDGVVDHYEGERGAERRVRVVRPDGSVLGHYEGETGTERLVRTLCANGVVNHYEGERGTERVVRLVHSDGKVDHYEGGRGSERCVRLVRSDGVVGHYEGERGAERLVRIVHSDGSVHRS